MVRPSDPPGVPVWWGRRYDGNTDGDVVISLGGGRVVATDWPYNGVIGVTTIDERERQIGRSYLGWTGDILGSPINYPGGDNVGTIDNTADNKQVIKDAIFEFFDGAGGRGTDGWKFVRDGVFGQLIQAQDADGYPLFYKSATDRTTTRTNTGLPVRFTAGGFIASTNAQLNEMRRNGVAFTLTPEQTASISSNIAERLATVVSGATPEEVRSIIQDALAGLSLQAVAAS